MHYKLRYLIPVGLILFSLFSFFQARVFAQDYILPYPGFMPGHPLYKISQVVDKLQEFWSFGSLAKFKYYLAMADKKLVETKTLFEYKQYLLASQALSFYEDYLKKASFYLEQAKNEGKNISEKRILFKNAIAKHSQVLGKLKEELPPQFVWRPEKEKARVIEIEIILKEAIDLTRKFKEE